MRLSSVAHLHAGQSGFEPIHTVLYFPFILCWEWSARVPERFHAWDRREIVVCSLRLTIPTNTLLRPHLRALHPNGSHWQRENRNLPAKKRTNWTSANQTKHSPCFLLLSEGLLWMTALTRLTEVTKVRSNASVRWGISWHGLQNHHISDVISRQGKVVVPFTTHCGQWHMIYNFFFIHVHQSQAKTTLFAQK